MVYLPNLIYKVSSSGCRGESRVLVEPRSGGTASGERDPNESFAPTALIRNSTNPGLAPGATS